MAPFPIPVPAILSVLAFLALTMLHAQPSDRPNIVLILADDLGYGDLGVYGSTQIETPHIDQLAKEGVRFTQAYVSSSVCAPSRAGLLTGRNQVEFGFDNNISDNQPGFDPSFLGLPVEVPTIADYLSEVGYMTGLVGKWHLGEQEPFHPLNRGFQEFWGYTGGGHDYFRSEEGGEGYLRPIESNFSEPGPIRYLTDDKGEVCVDFIKRHSDRPFFLLASFNAPHTPLQARESDLKRYGHIEDPDRRTYAAMVYRFDVNVGKIVNALKKEGLYRKTLIVFLSDNGGPVDQNHSLNAPLNGQKGSLLEGGIRVPMIVQWPGKFKEGSVYEPMVSALDLAPTFMKLAGVALDGKPLSGRDLFPFLNGTAQGNPHEDLKWRFTISAAIRSGDWKLVRLPDRLPRLYHLPTDISEQVDLSLQNLEKTKELLKKLGQWDVRLPHPVFLEGAEWKSRQLDLYDRTYPLVQE